MNEPSEIRFYKASGPAGYLSNLYRSALIFEGRTFDTAEQAYQFGKASDPKVADWIVSAPSPSLCAQAAHSLFVWQVRPNWSLIKVERMREVIRAKFEQNMELAAKLAQTGDAALVEESNMDAFWGIGKKGNGKNMLGQLLMELRASLR